MGLCMNRLILCMEVLAISFFYLHKVFKLPLFADVCIIGVNVYRQWGLTMLDSAPIVRFTG